MAIAAIDMSAALKDFPSDYEFKRFYEKNSDIMSAEEIYHFFEARLVVAREALKKWNEI
jgi:hypothetical protein